MRNWHGNCNICNPYAKLDGSQEWKLQRMQVACQCLLVIAADVPFSPYNFPNSYADLDDCKQDSCHETGTELALGPGYDPLGL